MLESFAVLLESITNIALLSTVVIVGIKIGNWNKALSVLTKSHYDLGKKVDSINNLVQRMIGADEVTGK